MSDKVVVRSDTDNHILFSLFKVFYPHTHKNKQRYICHKHAELEISCILEGTGIYNCAGKDYTYAPGDIFLQRGNDLHYFKTLDKNEHDMPGLIVIRFDSRFVWSPGGEWSNSKFLTLFMQTVSIERHIPHTAPVAVIIGRLLTEMFDECRIQAPSYDLIVKAKLMTILANMARYFHNELEQERSLNINQRYLLQMEHSINYILSHISEHLTLDELAKVACMSRSYYCIMFKTLNGISVWDYITNQRINLAQYHLENSNDSVLQISENSGFNSITNFNRAFKKLTGKTPVEYRKSLWKSDQKTSIK